MAVKIKLEELADGSKPAHIMINTDEKVVPVLYIGDKVGYFIRFQGRLGIGSEKKIMRIDYKTTLPPYSLYPQKNMEQDIKNLFSLPLKLSREKISDNQDEIFLELEFPKETKLYIDEPHLVKIP